MAREWIAGLSSERFQVKWAPVRVKKTRQNEDMESGSDLFRTGLQEAQTTKFWSAILLGLPPQPRFSTPRNRLSEEIVANSICSLSRSCGGGSGWGPPRDRRLWL